MRRVLGFVGLSILLLNGCSIVMSESELPGHYEGRMSDVSVSLNLRKDHTYSERLNLGKEKQENVDGQWCWDGRTLQLTLALIPDVYWHIRRNDWALSPEVYFGRMVLTDYGTDLELKKTK